MRSVLLLLLLAGCAPHLVANNELGGVVNVTGSFNQQKRGMEIAESECHKFGKVARYVSMNDLHGTLRYECLKP